MNTTFEFSIEQIYGMCKNKGDLKALCDKYPNLEYNATKQKLYRYRQKLKVEEVAKKQIKKEPKIKHNSSNDSIFDKSPIHVTDKIPTDDEKRKMYAIRQPSGKPKKNIIIPRYQEFIDWCKANPDVPFAESMVHNCEGSTRKHWRSIVKTTFDLLKKYNENN